MNYLSIISPVYKAEAIVDELVKRIHEEVLKITVDYEIILVDDGSPDSSWSKIGENCGRDAKVKGIKLSRNFGQHYAVTAGMAAANGKLIVIMDCDLQDDPSYISLLIDAYNHGNEIVFTKRIDRKHSFKKRISSWIYNLLFHFFSESRYDVDAGSLVLFTSTVRDVLLKLEDKDRLYVQMLKWVGYKNTYVAVEHKRRFSGESSYTLLKLIKLAMQGWTSHSARLLKLSVYGGFTLSLITFLISLVIVVRYFTEGFLPGWPSLFIAIMFSTGLILISIGIAGIYIGKIFEQSKRRPLFIVDKKINLD
ncbi:MAG TPA: glycosyltransferase family 2 protein [Cyclobacteriaceae bacterium]|jgi:dolichol-phosphate mannosyltransferase|nr:glycosyltransferase family 2 protein [Cyclobacteriaceae bacterium]